jgi:hypothetical protein
MAATSTGEWCPRGMNARMMTTTNCVYCTTEEGMGLLQKLWRMGVTSSECDRLVLVVEFFVLDGMATIEHCVYKSKLVKRNVCLYSK